MKVPRFLGLPLLIEKMEYSEAETTALDLSEASRQRARGRGGLAPGISPQHSASVHFPLGLASHTNG